MPGKRRFDIIFRLTVAVTKSTMAVKITWLHTFFRTDGSLK
jgi:hypothetical protein